MHPPTCAQSSTSIALPSRYELYTAPDDCYPLCETMTFGSRIPFAEPADLRVSVVASISTFYTAADLSCKIGRDFRRRTTTSRTTDSERRPANGQSGFPSASSLFSSCCPTLSLTSTIWYPQGGEVRSRRRVRVGGRDQSCRPGSVPAGGKGRNRHLPRLRSQDSQKVGQAGRNRLWWHQGRTVGWFVSTADHYPKRRLSLLNRTRERCGNLETSLLCFGHVRAATT